MSSETPDNSEAITSEVEDVDADEVPAEAEGPPAPDWIDLPRGEALNEEEAAEVMKVSPSKIVLVVGEQGSGKTSLLCGIYDRYLNGDFAGQMFCGSRTLRAFEQRSFLQRAEAARAVPATERTRLPAGQLALLHLELQAKATSERTALLMTDLAGEAFELIRNNPQECERYPVLSRVDYVVVLLDAERLGSSDRFGHLNSTRTTLRSILQSGSLRSGVPITLGLSKWDLINGKSAQDQARDDASAVLAPAADHRTDVARIAAAPEATGGVQPGYGLSGLVSNWIGADTPAEEIELVHDNEFPESDSGFDLFRAGGDAS